jgi:hypothetical protein
MPGPQHATDRGRRALERNFQEFADLNQPLQEPGITDAEYARRLDVFHRKYPQVVAKLRRQQQLQPAPINGSIRKGLQQGYFRTRLHDGTFGYLQRRADDCITYAIATCAQIPPNQAPDLHIWRQTQAGVDPEQIARNVGAQLAEWQHRHGVEIVVHPVAPTHLKRWIGIVPGHGIYQDHALVMSYRDCLFEMGGLFPEPEYGTGVNPENVDFGIELRS